MEQINSKNIMLYDSLQLYSMLQRHNLCRHIFHTSHDKSYILINVVDDVRRRRRVVHHIFRALSQDRTWQLERRSL